MCGNSMKHCYVKSLNGNEHWDDYQLKAMQIGGNKPLYEIMKDYELLELSVDEKYHHQAVVWYIKRLAAKLDDNEAKFDAENPKPPLDGEEEKEDWTVKTKASIAENAKKLGVIFNKGSKNVMDNSLNFADKKHD